MDKKKMIDLSAFLLFEAAGDSEGDDFDHKVMYLGGFSSDAEMLNVVEEDAQSSSYEYDHHHHNDDDDISHDHSINKNDCLVSEKRRQQVSVVGYNPEEDEQEEEEKDEDEDEAALRIHRKRARIGDEDGNRRGGKVALEPSEEVRSTASNRCRNRKSSCVDSSKRNKLSDIDQNKLFWEACLASS